MPSAAVVTRTAATPVLVTEGASIVGVDAELAGGLSTLSGTITGPGASPLAGVIVRAYAPDDRWVSSYRTTTRADGTYDLSLAAGQYRIYFTPPATAGLLPEWFDNTPLRSSALPIDVSAGSSIANIDAELASSA
jgi:hypothetical protein